MRPRRLHLLLGTLLALPACGDEPPLQPARPRSQAAHTARLQVAGRTIEVELAYTDFTRQRGLKHRTSLEPDCGMLFIFPEARPQRFWMQDTLIGLDIAFLDDDGTVQNIEHGRAGVEQPGYMSLRPARFVLEMEAGWCERAGLEPGDRIEIGEDLRALASG